MMNLQMLPRLRTAKSTLLLPAAALLLIVATRLSADQLSAGEAHASVDTGAKQPSSHQPMDGVEVIPLHQQQSAFPVKLSDNRLMVWWSQRDKAAVSNDGGAATTQAAYGRYSSDHGKTWSKPEKLLEFPTSDGSWSGSSILCDRNGAIHLFGIHFFGFNIKGNESAEQLKDIVPGKSPAFHVMSADGGKTWSLPQYCDFGHEYTGSTNGALQLSSGRILLPLSYMSRRLSGRFVTVVTRSDDGGKTWKPSRGECIVDSGSRNLESGAIEPVCVELADGRVWMLIRTNTGYLFESYSSDGGDTWSRPSPSRFRSTNAPGGLLRLSDGRIVMIWNNQKDQTAREVLAAAISADDGKTWSGYREVVRVKRPMRVKQLADNTVLLEHQKHYPYGLVTYPYLTEAADRAVIMGFLGPRSIVRVQPDWLAETSLQEDYSAGMGHWCTLDTEGVSLVDDAERTRGLFLPDAPKLLWLRKPFADTASGASLNFPFGARGRLSTRIRCEPGFRGARLCLTDAFSLPSGKEDGCFGIRIGPDGRLSVGKGNDRFTPTDVTLKTGKWHDIDFEWDCHRRVCRLSVDSRHTADLPALAKSLTVVTGIYQGDESGEERSSHEIHPAGICYLRLLLAAPGTDRTGLKLGAVDVSVTP